MDIPVIKGCDLCPELSDCRSRIVNGEGAEHPYIVWVGQNPTPDEDKQGRPFVGRSGALLAAFCDEVGIQKRLTRRVNAVRCMACGRTKPTNEEVHNCHDYLIEEIRALRPNVIVGLGETALDSLYLLPLHQIEMAHYLDEFVPEWERANERIFLEYTGNIAAWERACVVWKEAGATKGTGQGRPKKPPKPKGLPRPKAPTKRKMSMASVVGHTLIQPETGFPLVVSYHPAWLMRDNWGKGDLIVAQFEKIKRLAEGEVSEPLGEYRTVDSLEELRELRDYFISDAVKIVYFDTETFGGNDNPTGGLDWKNNELLTIQFTDRRDRAWVVPVLSQFGEPYAPWVGHYPEVFELLRDIFGTDVPKEAHNTMYDLRMLERDNKEPYIHAATAVGIPVNGDLRDSELAHQLAFETLPHNETTVLSLHTRMPYYESEIHHLSHNKKRMDLVPDAIRDAYGAGDADSIPRIDEVLLPIIYEEGTDFVLYNIANPLLRLCWNMERRGVPIDEEYFDALCRFYDARIDEEEEKLWESVPDYDWPKGRKYTYPPVLIDVMFRHLGLHMPDRKTKGGRTCDACKMGICMDHIQTGKDALLDIKAITPHPFLDALLTLKAMTKTKGTYLHGGKGGWKQHIEKADGRIHPSAKVSRAETGRLAFEKPNVHNPPKGIHIHPGPTMCGGKDCKFVFPETFGINSANAFRDIITAPPGKMILNADWSQLEVWVLAYFLRDMFGDTVLLDIMESGRDIHTAVARMIWPEDEELEDHVWRGIHGDYRNKAKPVVFGTNYGLTIHGLMERGHFTEAEATHIMTQYEVNVPGLPLYKQYIRDNLYQYGYVENRFKRRRHSRMVNILRKLGLKRELESLVRENFNFPIQSGGSDLHAFTSVITDNYEPLLKRNAVSIFSVHDSLTMEVDAPSHDYVVETAWMLKDLWKKIAWNMPTPEGDILRWTNPMEVQWGTRWGTPEWELNARGELIDLRAP